MRPGGGNEKGAKFEQEIIRMAKSYGHANADRTGHKQRSGKKGVKKVDPDIVGVGVFWLESKRLASQPKLEQYREALDKERPGYVNALVWRANHDPAPRVTLLFEDLLKLYAHIRVPMPPAAMEQMQRVISSSLRLVDEPDPSPEETCGACFLPASKCEGHGYYKQNPLFGKPDPEGK